MVKKIPVIIEDRVGAPTCSACYHKVVETYKGQSETFCYRYPPLIMQDDSGPYTIRILIEDTDRSCGEFKPVN